MNERVEKLKADKHHQYEMDDMDKFFAMSWGTPMGLLVLFVCFAVLLLSVGGFLVLLHLANIIK